MTESPNAVKMLLKPLEVEFEGKGIAKIETFTNAVGKNIYHLSFTDGVLQEWHETYTTLPQALARLAVLSACVESDDDEDKFFSFKNDPITFMIEATEFIYKQVA